MDALSAKEVARELGTDPKILRKFLRDITPKEDQPGQGGRYHIEPKHLKKLTKQFEEWSKARPTRVKTDTQVDEEIIKLGGVENPEDGSDPKPTKKKKSKKSKDPVVHELEPADDELVEVEDLDLDLDDIGDLGDLDLDDIEA